jgi:hypothetical protein
LSTAELVTEGHVHREETVARLMADPDEMVRQETLFAVGEGW